MRMILTNNEGGVLIVMSTMMIPTSDTVTMMMIMIVAVVEIGGRVEGPHVSNLLVVGPGHIVHLKCVM